MTAVFDKNTQVMTLMGRALEEMDMRRKLKSSDFGENIWQSSKQMKNITSSIQLKSFLGPPLRSTTPSSGSTLGHFVFLVAVGYSDFSFWLLSAMTNKFESYFLSYV